MRAGYSALGLTDDGKQIYAPAGHLLPKPPQQEYLTGHFVPTGRDPEVQMLSRAVVPHAETYLRETVEPQLDALRHEVAGVRGGGRVTEAALNDLKHLASLVRTLPAEMSYQITQADKVNDVKLTAPVAGEIRRLQSTYPWMAPHLVRLQHSLSEQALEDNVAIPAARQIGLG